MDRRRQLGDRRVQSRLIHVHLHLGSFDDAVQRQLVRLQRQSPEAHTGQRGARQIVLVVAVVVVVVVFA